MVAKQGKAGMNFLPRPLHRVGGSVQASKAGLARGQPSPKEGEGATSPSSSEWKCSRPFCGLLSACQLEAESARSEGRGISQGSSNSAQLFATHLLAGAILLPHLSRIEAQARKGPEPDGLPGAALKATLPIRDFGRLKFLALAISLLMQMSKDHIAHGLWPCCVGYSTAITISRGFLLGWALYCLFCSQSIDRIHACRAARGRVAREHCRRQKTERNHA